MYNSDKTNKWILWPGIMTWYYDLVLWPGIKLGNFLALEVDFCCWCVCVNNGYIIWYPIRMRSWYQRVYRAWPWECVQDDDFYSSSTESTGSACSTCRACSTGSTGSTWGIKPVSPWRVRCSDFFSKLTKASYLFAEASYLFAEASSCFPTVCTGICTYYFVSWKYRV